MILNHGFGHRIARFEDSVTLELQAGLGEACCQWLSDGDRALSKLVPRSVERQGEGSARIVAICKSAESVKCSLKSISDDSHIT